MDEITRTLPATLDYLMGWLRRYVQADRTAKRQGWRFRVGNRHNYVHQGIQRQQATIEADGVPVVEVWATQQGDTCEVKLRCNESALAEWWEALRLAMGEKWPVYRQESPDKIERKGKVKAAWEAGTPIERIAETLGVSEATVKRDLRGMKLTQK